MTNSPLAEVSYDGQSGQSSWRGMSIDETEEFSTFLSNEVSARLFDEEGSAVFEPHLRGLANTGFARHQLDLILRADKLEQRTWAIGEAMAEAYLTREYEVTWPWNTERDKRNPSASLPGADLVGFTTVCGKVRLVLGEVKTSADNHAPPGVMTGRSGMTCQLDNLAKDLGLIAQLLKWLLPRCKGTEHEATFNAAVIVLLNSGNRDIALFGVLIRDTPPNELDLKSRGETLARSLQDPTTCRLIAIYIPCAIDDLLGRVVDDTS